MSNARAAARRADRAASKGRSELSITEAIDALSVNVVNATIAKPKNRKQRRDERRALRRNNDGSFKRFPGTDGALMRRELLKIEAQAKETVDALDDVAEQLASE